jgi:prephenate dehydratase
MQCADATRAAIAGSRAAELYGAAIIRKSIQDQPENFTQFVLLKKEGNKS